MAFPLLQQLCRLLWRGLAQDPLPPMLAIAVWFWEPILAVALLIAALLMMNPKCGPPRTMLPGPKSLLAPPAPGSIDPEEVCPLCRDVHHNPIALPCAHVLCEECLTTLIVEAKREQCLVCLKPFFRPAYAPTLHKWVFFLTIAVPFLALEALRRLICRHFFLTMAGLLEASGIALFMAHLGVAFLLCGLMGCTIEDVELRKVLTREECMYRFASAVFFIWWYLATLRALD